MKSSVVKQDKSNSNKTDYIAKGATFEDIIKYMVSDKVTSANMAKKKAKKEAKK